MAQITRRETRKGVSSYDFPPARVNPCKPHLPSNGVVTDKSGGGYDEVMVRPTGHESCRAFKPMILERGEVPREHEFSKTAVTGGTNSQHYESER